MTAPDPPVARRHRGVPRPARIPEGTPAVTLREGGTPLVHSEWLSGLTRAEVWLKVEGDNPTGSFKDRGMTAAISVAGTRAPRPWSAPRPATPRRRWRPTPPRPGSSRWCSCPRARSPPARWRRRSCTAPRSSWCAATSTTASRSPRGWPGTTRSRWSTRSTRCGSQGQKTAAFEIVDFLGDAPDFHLLPVGNAGNISAYWMGYTQYADLGLATKRPSCAASRPRARRRW